MRDAKAEIKKLQAAGKTDEAGKQDAALKPMQEDWELARARFDVAFRQRKATQEAIAALKTRIEQEKKQLERLEGKTAPAPVPSEEKPSTPAPTPAPAPAPPLDPRPPPQPVDLPALALGGPSGAPLALAKRRREFLGWRGRAVIDVRGRRDGRTHALGE